MKYAFETIFTGDELLQFTKAQVHHPFTVGILRLNTVAVWTRVHGGREIRGSEFPILLQFTPPLVSRLFLGDSRIVVPWKLFRNIAEFFQFNFSRFPPFSPISRRSPFQFPPGFPPPVPALS